MRTILIAAAAASLGLMPLAASAQGGDKNEGLHGPPNANGYDKGDKAGATSDAGEPGSGGTKMKGPPNANGMTTDDKH